MIAPVIMVIYSCIKQTNTGESAGQQEHEGQEDGGDEEAAKTSGKNSKFDDLHIPAHLSRMVRVP